MDGQRVEETAADDYCNIFDIGRELGYSDEVLDDVDLFERDPKSFFEMVNQSDLSHSQRTEYINRIFLVGYELHDVEVDRRVHNFVEAVNPFLSGLLKLIGL